MYVQSNEAGCKMNGYNRLSTADLQCKSEVVHAGKEKEKLKDSPTFS